MYNGFYPLPRWLWVGSLLHFVLAGWCKGLFLCDREAAAGGLLDETLVDVGHDLLESRAVKSLAENGSPADDTLSGLHLFGVAVQHFCFNLVPQGFSFGFGFVNQGFQLLQSFDLGCDFDGRLFVFPFIMYLALGIPTLKSSSSHVNGASVSLGYGFKFVGTFG